MLRVLARLGTSLFVALSFILPMVLYAKFPSAPYVWLAWSLPIFAFFLLWRFGAPSRQIRQQQAVLNLNCPHCGYDVTEQFRRQVDHCPECGKKLDYARFMP